MLLSSLSSAEEGNQTFGRTFRKFICDVNGKETYCGCIWRSVRDSGVAEDPRFLLA
jgi:hypothetical protein